MHSGVGGQTGSAQIWSTIHQQLRVPDLPPDVFLTDWAPCPQQVTLVMMRPVVSTAQSMSLQVLFIVEILVIVGLPLETFEGLLVSRGEPALWLFQQLHVCCDVKGGL